jgi:HlyD family secretion protein
MNRAVTACALLLFGLAGAACQPQTQSSANPHNPPQTRDIVALGRLEPENRVVEIGVAGEERLQELLVKQGQFVKAGEVLAYLESYKTRVATRDHAASQLRDAEAQLHANTEAAQARIHEANLRLQQLSEVPMREIEAQQAKLRALHADFVFATTDQQRIRGLEQSGVGTRQELERQASQVDRLKANIDAEQATLSQLQVAAQTDRQLAEAQLATRRAELQSIQASAQLESLRQAVHVSEVELENSVVRAPSNGQIIEIVANPGETVMGRVILRMGDVRQMYVMAEVYETDVARVRVGQAVQVTSPSLSKTQSGVVERIGTSVFKRQVRSIDPQEDADARVIQIRARLAESEEASHFVGLQVEVRIDTGK